MSVLSGHVLSIETRNLGEPTIAAASIGATALTVADASTFDENGGLVTVGGVQLPYTGINLDTETINLTDPLAVAVDEGAKVDVYPPTPVKTALVSLDDGGDTIPATVPHALLDKFSDGIRDPSTGESVTLERRGNYEFLVSDLVAEQLVQTSLDFTEAEQGIMLSEQIAQFKDVSVLSQIGAASVAADTITLAGSDLATQLSVTSIGKLLAARLPQQGSSIAITTTATKVFELNCGTVPGGRTYRASTSMLINGSGTLALSDRIQFRYFYTTDGSAPTPTGTLMDGGFNDNSFFAGNLNYVSPQAEVDLASEALLRVGLVVDLISGAGTYSIYAGATAASRPVMSLYDDGPSGTRQDSAITLTGGGTSRFVKTFNPTWASGIQNGNWNEFASPSYIDIGNSVYGYGMFGAIGYNSADIVSKLAGVTTPISLVVRWRPRSRSTGTGLDVRFLSHNYTSLSAFTTSWFPQGWDDISQPGDLTSLTTFANAAPNTPYDQSLGTTLFSQFRTGTRKGIAIAPSMTPSINSHPDGTGTFYSFGTYQPQLIFTYDGTS